MIQVDLPVFPRKVKKMFTLEKYAFNHNIVFLFSFDCGTLVLTLTIQTQCFDCQQAAL